MPLYNPPASGSGISDGDTLSSGLTFPNSGLHILDTNATHDLIVSAGSDLTGDRTLSIVTGDSNRTVTLSGNLTVSSAATVSGTNTGDQTSVSGNAGTATALATARAIYGNNFDGTAALTQVIASAYGGTGNGFAKFSGPTSTEKTFSLPDATCTILTTNAAVTLGQGGTGVSLSDPAANKLMAWDDTDNAVGFWTVGTGLSYDHSTHTLSASGSGSATTALDNLASVAINAALVLGTSDAFALGSATKMWSDLFLASGAVVNFNNGDVTVTHASNLLSFDGASSGYSFDAKVFPASDDGAALGDTTHNFSDLFLASGAVVNVANGNVVLTHSSGILTLGTGTLKITTPTNNSTSVLTTDGVQTVSGKIITKRVHSQTSASSLTPDFDSYDIEKFTALAADLTINAPSNTPRDGDPRAIMITDNGTSRTLTFNSIYQAVGVTLPSATTVSKKLRIVMVYDSSTSKYECLSVNLEA